jgi:hypothetical protein
MYNLVVRAKESRTERRIGFLCGKENDVVEEIDVCSARISSARKSEGRLARKIIPASLRASSWGLPLIWDIRDIDDAQRVGKDA